MECLERRKEEGRKRKSAASVMGLKQIRSDKNTSLGGNNQLAVLVSFRLLQLN